MKKILSFTAFLLFAVPIALQAAEIAVIPYRVDNPANVFPATEGEEYSKLLGIVLAIKKNIEVYSIRKLQQDIRDFGIDTQGTLTRETLGMLGKSRYLDYILAGSLYRADGGFVAKSILYSVREDRIVGRADVRADGLFELAEREITEMFISRPDRTRTVGSGRAETVGVVCDLSYNVFREFNDLKRGIENGMRKVSGSWENPLTVHIVPVSTHYRAVRRSPVSSPLGLKNVLEGLKPRGGGNIDIFEEAMKNTVRLLPPDSHAMIISNSPVSRSRAAERYALMARRKKIRIHTVSLGKHSRDDRNLMKQIAVITRGTFHSAAYHQRVYDTRGRKHDIFAEAGRIFASRGMAGSWKEGLFARRGSDSAYQKPRDNLSEIFAGNIAEEPGPYALPRFYNDATQARIINSEMLENNLEEILANLGHKVGRGQKGAQTRTLGRVLLSQGDVSLWARVINQDDMNFFKRMKANGRIFTMGVVVAEKSDNPYGISFHPGAYVYTVPADSIPASIKVNLREIIAAPLRYISRGLLKPPVWFLELRVAEVRSSSGLVDVREENR